VRYETAGAVLNGLLNVVGGGTGTGYLGRVEVYDPRRNSWGVLPDTPTACGFLAAGALGGKLYAAGGTDESGALATTEAYTPARP
jgi:hypothetical protein